MSSSSSSDQPGASGSSSSYASETDGTSVVNGHHLVELSLTDFEKAFFRPAPSYSCNPKRERSRFSACVRTIRRSHSLGLGSVCNLLNLMSNVHKESCENQEKQLVVFVDHAGGLLAHHPDESNSVQPHVIAVQAPIANSWYADGQRRGTLASVKDKSPPNRSPIAWHHVLSAALVDLAVEKCQPMDLTADCLGSLNQARPDLSGCFSLSITRASCRIWWSDAAGLYATPELAWDDPATVRAVFGYVDRLYNPLMVDPSISLADVRCLRSTELHGDPPAWLIRDDRDGVYHSEAVISVGPPWSRKGWVVRASRYKAPDAKVF
ncbi:hypothetical protein AURDEDRAFT_159052, partial [Auricularia subglabra TFB-10046 SS5]